MKLGMRESFGFLCLTLVAFCGEPALADGTDNPLGIRPSRTSSDLILPGDSWSDGHGEDACQWPDAKRSRRDNDCHGGGYVDLSSRLDRELAGRVRFGDWSRLPSGIADAWPAAFTQPSSRSLANDNEPEAWRAYANPERAKANGWTAQITAGIGFSPFEMAQSPLHPTSGGAAAGLFGTFAIAAKKLLLLILAGPSLALRDALHRRMAVERQVPAGK